jgi:hypothetical protein
MKFTSLAISAYLAYTVSSLPVEAVAPVADAVAPVSDAVASPLWYFYFRRALEEVKREDSSALLYGKGKREDGY